MEARGDSAARWGPRLAGARRRVAARLVLLALAFGASCAARAPGDSGQAGAAPSVAKRPNIVVLYADDAGFADFGFQPSARADLAERTPHIDAIAKAGVRFSNAYMSGCVCSPSRAGLLTGRYQQRFGHELNLPPGYSKGGLPLSEKTMADRLRALGYRTGLVGKWHLGYPAAYHPNERGFDWFYGCLQGSRSYYPMRRATPHRVIQENGEATPEGGYTTDRFGDAAVRFLSEAAGEPFFLFVSFTAPHGPLQPREADLDALGDIEKPRRRKYAGLVKALDDNVGKILAALRARGLEDETLVVFTNDNGGQTLTGAVNAPLRGRKGQLYEGGIRVPMCMRLPGRIAAGSVIDEPVLSLDLLPTFVALAGGRVDEGWKLDGVDLLPRVTGARDALAARSLFWRHGGPQKALAIRRGKWKLLYPDRGVSATPQLYDLSSDLAESRDVAPENDRVVASLREELFAWEAQLVAPLWAPARRRRRR